jgi:hypothetical protein
MDRREISSKILELCSEDEYGSWELWWAVSPGRENDVDRDLQLAFIDVIEDLTRDGKIVAKERIDGLRSQIAPFSRERLKKEINSAFHPDANSFYWFDSGKRAS